MKRILLLDFDRTLFNTNKFYDAVWSNLASAYGIDPQTEIERAPEFYRYLDDFHDYDFFAHLKALEVGRPDDIIAELQQSLEGEEYLYPDAYDALRLRDEYDLSILTFGNERYQRFKLSFCRPLDDIPVAITLLRKGDYLSEHYPNQEVTIVDDKQLLHTLPETACFIHLDRQQFEPVLHHDEYISIKTLSQLPEALAQ